MQFSSVDFWPVNFSSSWFFGPILLLSIDLYWNRQLADREYSREPKKKNLSRQPDRHQELTPVLMAARISDILTNPVCRPIKIKVGESSLKLLLNPLAANHSYTHLHIDMISISPSYFRNFILAALVVGWRPHGKVRHNLLLFRPHLWGKELYTQMGFFFCSVNFGRSIYSS